MIQPQVAISRCLLGERVNYEGKHNLQALIVDELAPYLSIVPFCPEVSIGLSTPRPPLELIVKDDLMRIKEAHTSHTDHSKVMGIHASEFVDQHRTLSGVITQSKSPSCAATDAPVLSTRHNSISYHSGFFIERLKSTYPFLPIIDETLLEHQDYRHRFLTHSFALARFYNAIQSNLLGPVKQFQDRYRPLLTALAGSKATQLAEIQEAWQQKKATQTTYINYLGKLLQMPFSASCYISAIETFTAKQNYANKSKLRLLTRMLKQSDTEQVYSALFIQHLWKLLKQFDLDSFNTNPLFYPYPPELLSSTSLGRSNSAN